jgi:hypothetical protein
LAPIFTPARSVSVPEPAYVDDVPHQFQNDVPVQVFTPEQTKEAFDVARNSIELLSTVLSSSPEQDVLQVSFCVVLCCIISCICCFFRVSCFMHSFDFVCFVELECLVVDRS